MFTKNETMMCGLKNIDMADDCLNYEIRDPGYSVNRTLILPCRVVTDLVVVVESGSNYQSPNFHIIIIDVFIYSFYLKR